ncbi:MAG: amidase family protein [Vicinamibacterales bacterium]
MTDAFRRERRWLTIAGALTAFSLHAQSGPAAPAAPFRLLETTIDDIHAAMQSGRLTCRSLTTAYLARIEAYDKHGPAINAVQTVNARALDEADRLDAAFAASGAVGPLHCVPMLVKDQIETRDMPTTFGSALFRTFTPERDATVVVRLRKAGALVIGKSTMGEFASGYIGSASGVIRNAYDPRRNASGSSGGSASGVAANFAAASLGEDTGGSIRGPAAVNNIVGLRPTTALVSRFGMMPARPTTDTIGPLARTVRDLALVLDAIAGYDPHDLLTAAAAGHVPASYAASLSADDLRGARIGVIRQPMDAKTDVSSDDYKKVRAVIDRAIARMAELGAHLVDPVLVPGVVDRLSRAYDENVFETEAATNAYLAEHANAPVRTFHDILLSGRVAPARARTLMPSVGKSVGDLGYLRVVLEADRLRQDVLGIMAEHRLDAIVYATFDHQGTVIAPDVLTRTSVDDFAGFGNNRRLSPVLGFPALTVPAGFTSDDLPVGLELMARPFEESRLIHLAFAFEQATHHRKPPATVPALPAAP